MLLPPPEGILPYDPLYEGYHLLISAEPVAHAGIAALLAGIAIVGIRRIAGRRKENPSRSYLSTLLIGSGIALLFLGIVMFKQQGPGSIEEYWSRRSVAGSFNF